MLTSLAFIFLIGLSMAAICQKIRLPRIIGMLFTGIVLGPYVLNLLDPAKIIIGGGVTQMKGFPKQRLEEKIKRMSRKPYPAEDLPIVYTIPGKYDGVIGAALCALEQI